MTAPDTIRNFSIIAHIDHGKSTLADRMIEATGGLSRREMTDQVLDSMDLERERGITIKAQTVRLTYTARDGIDYTLNLMDTPGHVDFAYEVSRCLAACEGSLLLVDASQGVEAQTLANVYQALDADLEILPVLNKIDLDAADPQATALQIEQGIGLDASDALHVSAKTGNGVVDVLEAIVTRLPPPQGDPDADLRALLVDAYYDPYMGVVVIVRVVDGVMHAGTKIRMVQADSAYEPDKVGVFTPAPQTCSALSAGEIGFFTASIKRVADCRIGDTIVGAASGADLPPLPGFKPVQPVVFCGLFPTSASDFDDLRAAMGKLALNDASFTYETESSSALGMGFRCGFLGLLHLEIVHERLIREFSLDLVTTAPSVVYAVTTTDGAELEVHNPADMPERTRIAAIGEPWITATIYTPDDCLGAVISLCIERRGVQKDLSYVGGRACLRFELPLNEVVFDFHDRLKSVSRGYASFDYTAIGTRQGDLVTMDIRINDEPVDALSILVHRSKADMRGRAMCQRLKDLIPRHMFKIPIQAAIGGKVIARETLPALRKDVTSKCYGGDITRKRKLLERQKAGKKKMQSIGKVNIPQQAFIAALKMKDA